jgi:hypothetical protein
MREMSEPSRADSGLYKITTDLHPILVHTATACSVVEIHSNGCEISVPLVVTRISSYLHNPDVCINV